MSVANLRALIFLCFITITVPLYCQKADPLAFYLNPSGLSPVPAHTSYYKPGAIIIVTEKHPQYRGPEDDVSVMKPEAAQASLADIDFSNKKAVSASLRILGFTPGGTFAKSTTLKATALVMNGWHITTAEHDAILKPGTATFKYISDHWERTGLVGGQRVFYLVTDVYLSSKADVTSTSGVDVTLTSSTAQTCDASDPTKTAAGDAIQTAAQTIADLATGTYQGAVKFCTSGSKHVSFTYDSPVPVAMIVERLTLFSNTEPLRADGATVVF